MREGIRFLEKQSGTERENIRESSIDIGLKLIIFQKILYVPV